MRGNKFPLFTGYIFARLVQLYTLAYPTSPAYASYRVIKGHIRNLSFIDAVFPVFNIRSTAGAAGISALILVFRETYISLPPTMLSSVNLYNPNVWRL